ncbi:MAG: prolipoprotein diacylglyceryl transferase family protein [Thermodesulfobacteriota bacterium]
MSNEVFLLLLTSLYLILLSWSWRSLPTEKWQIIAAIPRSKNGGDWEGTNLTFYGFFLASALALSAALLVVMLGAIEVMFLEAFLIAAPVLAVGVPASRWVARVVENKPQTATVAGASFIGLALAPWLILALRRILGPDSGPGLDVVPILAALAVAYAFGEGLGRLACISFGCCYGKPLADCHPFLQRLFRGRSFIFSGPTKKIAYESRLDGRPVLPIQAITSLVCVGAGLAGLYLFLTGHFRTAFLLSLTLTQLWRAFSETMRADYRGHGRFTVYQYLALAAVVYGLSIVLTFPTAPSAAPRLSLGLDLLWRPEALLALQGLWLAVFLSRGLSKVTGASIRFYVRGSQI